MIDSGDFDFSFSGLNFVRYLLPRLESVPLADTCASFQEAIVDVLVAKDTRGRRDGWTPRRRRERRRELQSQLRVRATAAPASNASLREPRSARTTPR